MREDIALAASSGAEAVELRLDYLDCSPTKDQLKCLIDSAEVDVIATNRVKSEGGRFEGDENQRLEILNLSAELEADFVDVEFRAKAEELPDADIIHSYHDFEGIPQDLEEITADIDASRGDINKIIFTATGPEDALTALDIVRQCKKPTIALAMGEAGVISRILAKKFGAFGTFAALAGGAESAPGQPTLDEFRNLYRWDSINLSTEVFGIIGCPVAHSMSPAIHNAAFDAAEIDGVYVPLLIQLGTENFNRFMDAVLARPWLDWRGLSVTIPHKENALAYVGSNNCDELSRKIGAINTISIDKDGKLGGFNTDYAGAIDALCAAMDIDREQLAGKSVAVLGAGGAARAIVAALSYYGAETTIYNRTVSRGEKLADEFGCRCSGLDKLDKLDAEILINCTSLGMHPNIRDCPLEKIPPSIKVVFDTIYNPIETRLLWLAKQAGCLCVSGLDMFVNQAVGQFEIWTKTRAPANAMRKVVIERLKQS